MYPLYQYERVVKNKLELYYMNKVVWWGWWPCGRGSKNNISSPEKKRRAQEKPFKPRLQIRPARFTTSHSTVLPVPRIFHQPFSIKVLYIGARSATVQNGVCRVKNSLKWTSLLGIGPWKLRVVLLPKYLPRMPRRRHGCAFLQIRLRHDPTKDSQGYSICPFSPLRKFKFKSPLQALLRSKEPCLCTHAWLSWSSRFPLAPPPLTISTRLPSKLFQRVSPPGRNVESQLHRPRLRSRIWRCNPGWAPSKPTATASRWRSLPFGIHQPRQHRWYLPPAHL